jgi:hypothetical protein
MTANSTPSKTPAMQYKMMTLSEEDPTVIILKSESDCRFLLKKKAGIISAATESK